MLACARRALVVLVVALFASVPFEQATTASYEPPPTAVTRTDLSLVPHQRTVHYAHSVRLAAQLRGVMGPLVRQRVEFWARTAGGSWHRVSVGSTDTHGWARLLERRLRRTTRWQARFGGNLVDSPTRSAIATIRVLPPPHMTLDFGRQVVREAARHHGAPYQYGATGPSRFDCSGFTMYVFGRFGISLPHNAAAQYDSVRHVSHAAMRLGDLVFFTGSGGIYHVGIYAGGGEMWAATHSGDVVRLESISGHSYVVGRVR